MAIYDPAIFNISDIHEAKAIILTPEGGETTNHRWETETPFIANQVAKECQITSDSLVLDFGCGVGRIAKMLIDSTQCRVIGVDISESMRKLSADYVQSERFTALSPMQYYSMVQKGLRVDSAYSIWVLQHCLSLEEEIELIRHSLRNNARLHVVNNIHRAIPTNEGWLPDNQDVRRSLLSAFREINCFQLPDAATIPLVRDLSYCGTYVKKRKFLAPGKLW